MRSKQFPVLAWVEVDLDAITKNVRVIRRQAGVPVIAVVKCDGYGHGLVASARAALQGGASAVAVRGLGEVRELRLAGVRARVIDLLPSHPVDLRHARSILREGVEPTVEDTLDVELFSQAAGREGMEAAVHLKVDTGLHRNGADPVYALTVIKKARACPNLRLESLYTTFSERGHAETRRELRRLRRLEKESRAAGAILHAATSATLADREAVLDAVRPGLAIFGVGPSRPLRGLTPALALRATVAGWDIVKPREYVGYGRLHQIRSERRVGLISIGSVDGLPRSLSGRGQAIVAGRKLRLIGRVSLNNCFVALPDVPDSVDPGIATMIGAEGRERIRVEEVARSAVTSPYEILVRLSPRLERRYFKRGKLVEVRTVRDEYRSARRR